MKEGGFNIRKTLLLLIIALMCSKLSFAQKENTTDLESWNYIQFAYKPIKKLQFELESQYRLKENISATDRSIIQIGTQYSIYKKLKIAVALRYTNKNDIVGKIQGYRNYLRYNIDASNRHKFDDFWIKYRLRYQDRKEFEESILTETFDNPYFRYKLGFSYNIKKWKLEPEVSGELFDPIAYGERLLIDAFRITVGASYSMKKSSKIEIFYRLDKEKDEVIYKTKNIIGLKYSYTLKGY